MLLPCLLTEILPASTSYRGLPCFASFWAWLQQVFNESIYPWQPNTTTWKNQTAPLMSINSSEIRTEVVACDNSSSAILITRSPVLEITDTFRAEGDSIYITSVMTSLLDYPVTMFVPLLLGNIQVGSTTSGCKCPVVLFSGHGSADGHGQSNNCSNACNTGLFHVDRCASLLFNQPAFLPSNTLFPLMLMMI